MRHQPANTAELREAIRQADRVQLRGGETKCGAHPALAVIDLRAMTGVLAYSPEECVFTARAGTPVRDITSILAAHDQYLPFDPPFAADGATLGGTVASGMSGPRRYRYGGVRDFLIGVQVVDGEGRLIRSGGKVVKNAAGFLLHHGMVGSYGAFGALAEVTFKVFPSPAARRTVTVATGSVEAAFALAQRIERARRDCEAIDFDDRGTLVVTIAGCAEAIDGRAAAVAAALPAGTVPEIGDCPRGEGLSPGVGSVPRVGDRPPGEGLSPDWGTDLAWVKVAGAGRSWRKLHQTVTTARFLCAGAVAWLGTRDTHGLATALREAGLVGQIFRGPGAGQRIGDVRPNVFEERVRRVLDPQNRFRAASDPDR